MLGLYALQFGILSSHTGGGVGRPLQNPQKFAQLSLDQASKDFEQALVPYCRQSTLSTQSSGFIVVVIESNLNNSAWLHILQK